MYKSKTIIFEITEEYIERYALNKNFKGKTIVLYKDRIHHIERHRLDFSNDKQLDFILRNLSKIIKNPDFITEDNKNNSLQIVKKIEDNILIAVRISNGPILKIKTIYPINETKYSRLMSNSTNI